MRWAGNASRAATKSLTRLATVTSLAALLLVLTVAPAAAQSETIEYYGLDALGSVRVIFTAQGVERMNYGPFGENLGAGVTFPAEMFAQLARDAESGQDYAQARNYSTSTGRFNRVDPVYAGLFNPQAWNRYAYVLQNPISLTDPTGLCEADYCWNEGTINVFGGPPIPLRGAWSAGTDDLILMLPETTLAQSGNSIGVATSTATDKPQTTPTTPTTPADQTLLDKVKEAVCSAIPDGRTVGVQGGIGGLGSTHLGGEILLNYNTGQVSVFGLSGSQGGWNGLLSVSVSVGFVQNLGSKNSNYSGWFVGPTGSGGIPGVPVSAGGSVMRAPNGVTSASVSASKSLAGKASGGIEALLYSKPFDLAPFSGFTTADRVMFAVRQACK